MHHKYPPRVGLSSICLRNSSRSVRICLDVTLLPKFANFLNHRLKHGLQDFDLPKKCSVKPLYVYDDARRKIKRNLVVIRQMLRLPRKNVLDRHPDVSAPFFKISGKRRVCLEREGTDFKSHQLLKSNRLADSNTDHGPSVHLPRLLSKIPGII